MAADREPLTQADAVAAGLRAFQSIDVHDLDAWRALGESLWTDDIEMVEDPRWPGAGEFHGRDEVAARFHDYFQAFDRGEAELERVHGDGDERVLELIFRARGAGSGAAVEQRWAWRVRFRGGRLASIRPYLELDEALAAAGISG